MEYSKSISNDCCHVYSLFYFTFLICVMCQRGLFVTGVCMEWLEIFPCHLSLPQVHFTVFLGFLIYCIVWGMPKTQTWRYLSIGSRTNHTAASCQHCLHCGGCDGYLAFQNTPRSLMLIWMSFAQYCCFWIAIKIFL